MLRKPPVACLVALALTVIPAMAQTPAQGPTASGAAVGSGSAPAQATAPGAQGTVVGTPKSPESTDAQRGASLVPVAYLGLIALGAAGAFWYVWRRRRGRG